MRASLVAISLGLHVAVACSSSTSEGVSASIVLETPREPHPQITNEKGFAFTLTQEYLATGSVEIRACEGTVADRWSFGMPTAWAHSVGSPTLLGAPAVESMLATANTRVVMGTLVPPARVYCSVVVGFHP